MKKGWLFFYWDMKNYNLQQKVYQLLHVLNMDLYEVYTVFVNDRGSNTK